MMAAPVSLSCTVIICTRDRPEQLDRCLAAVARLTYPTYEVLVVDNAPTTTETRDITKRWTAAYLLEPVQGLSRARNSGARAASTDLVAYLDDDSIPEPEWLTHLAAEFATPAVMAAAGRILPLVAEDATGEPARWTGSLDRGGARRVVTHAHPLWFELANFGGIGSGGNMAFRRAAFEAWPGFDERLGRGAPIPGGEDYHAFFSLIERGFEVVYAPAAVVHHPDRPDLERRRAQHLKDVAASVGYITLLFVERPAYRRRLIRYIVEWLQDTPRPWRAPADAPRSQALPAWWMMKARLTGVLLYFRCRLSPLR
jgi:cellulose synthase/poly-beta-1,6-N-acetylglucosamine synthase-like glycosyltransferase